MDNNKLHRILSVIALVFVLIFSVSLILFFIDPYMLGGVVALMCLVSGFIGLMLFAILKILMKQSTNGLAGYIDSNGDCEPDEEDEPSEESEPSTITGENNEDLDAVLTEQNDENNIE